MASQLNQPDSGQVITPKRFAELSSNNINTSEKMTDTAVAKVDLIDNLSILTGVPKLSVLNYRTITQAFAPKPTGELRIIIDDTDTIHGFGEPVWQQRLVDDYYDYDEWKDVPKVLKSTLIKEGKIK